MHHAIESAQFPSSSNTSPLEVSPGFSASSTRSRSNATSPTEIYSATMPSVAEGFDSLNARYAEHDSRRRPHLSRGTSSAAVGASNISSHANAPQTIDLQSPLEGRNQNFGPYQQNSSALPPIRDISTLQARPEEPLPYHSYPNGYSQASGNFQGAENASYLSSRRGLYDSGQRASPLYPPIQNVAGLESAEYSRNVAMPHNHGQHPGPYGAYANSEYPSHMLGSPPYPSYGGLGDTTRKRRGNLPKHVTDILKAWFQEHLDHPYPTEEDKRFLHNRTMLSIQQVSIACPKSLAVF